jgi:hypothetical protein
VLTTHPLLEPRSSMSRAINLLPLWALCGLLWGDLYLYLIHLWHLPLCFIQDLHQRFSTNFDSSQDSIQEEMKGRMKAGSAWYQPVQNILYSILLSKNIKIKIHRSYFCLLLCMGVKLGRSHWGRNTDWQCLRKGCWGAYLGLRGTR